MYEIFKGIIATGNYILENLEERILKVYALGRLTTEEMTELLDLANANVNDTLQIDIAATLADLEQRVSVLESAGIVVWKSGMVTAKGQTVLYDILREGTLRYCRYDGGRATTSLSPGKIDGWVILASAGGAVTHTVQKDENGNIILVPVEGDANE